MVTLKSVNYDSYVKTTLVDGSILPPSQDPSPVGFSFLCPIFSKKGEDNVIKRFTSSGSFAAEYGDDTDSEKKYGHGGVIAGQVFVGGGAVSACRLMPDDAKKASQMLVVDVSDTEIGKTSTAAAVAAATVALDKANADVVTAKAANVIASAKHSDATAIAATAAADAVTAEGLSNTAAAAALADPTNTTLAAAAVAAATVSATAAAASATAISAVAATDIAFVAAAKAVADANAKVVTATADLAAAIAADGVVVANTPFEGKIKVIVKSVPYDHTVPFDTNFAVSKKTIDGVVYTRHPLFSIDVGGRGSYGNDIGFKFYADPERNGKKTTDGCRYVVDFVEKQQSGAVIRIGHSHDVISAAFNENAVAIPGTDIVDAFDSVFDAYARAYKLPVSQKYSPENYATLIAKLKTIEPSVDYNKTDILSVVSAKLEYEFVLSNGTVASKYVIDATTGKYSKALDGSWNLSGFNVGDVTYYPSNGSDGSLNDVGVKDALLIKFFRGEVDESLFDPRLVDAGILLDAWYSAEVKKVIGGYFGAEVRDDIYTFLDVGPGPTTLTEAVAASKMVAQYISHPYGSVSINIHNGKTTNRSRNFRTSGNYELASAIPSLYLTRGSFTTLAGVISGRVRNMVFDFFPKVVKDDIQISPLREANLLFAMKLDKSGAFYWMSDDSHYVADYSVLNSATNLIFAGEVIRTFKRVLVRYSFHPENAAGAIPEATAELKSTFAGSYFPAKMPVTFTIFQTRNDTINNTASVACSITYPDRVEAWKVTITANRQPMKK